MIFRAIELVLAKVSLLVSICKCQHINSWKENRHKNEFTGLNEHELSGTNDNT